MTIGHKLPKRKKNLSLQLSKSLHEIFHPPRKKTRYTTLMTFILSVTVRISEFIGPELLRVGLKTTIKRITLSETQQDSEMNI